jgi:hypothetical protein
MKIDLTKEEWEFLYYSAKQYVDFYKDNMKLCADPVLYRMSEKFLKKLGSEWIDEEEEIRKFYEGFAYRPRKKDDYDK